MTIGRKGWLFDSAWGAGLVVQGVDGCVVMACDQPAVTAEHLRVLMARVRLRLRGMRGGWDSGLFSGCGV